MAEAKPAEAAKPKRGLLGMLPLIAVLVLSPVAGWFGLAYYQKKKKMADPQAAAKPEGEAEKGHESKESKGGGHGKEKAKPSKLPPRLPIPIALSELVVVAGNPELDLPPRIVSTNFFKMNGKKPEEIVIMFADTTKKKHYAVFQIYLAAENSQELMNLMNEHQTNLYENLTNMLSAKRFKDTKIPGFRNLLRSEIIGLANQVFETNLVREAILSKFIAQ